MPTSGYPSCTGTTGWSGDNNTPDMNAGPVKSWTDRLLEMAVALVATGLLLNWAWQLIQPLVPVLVVAGVFYGAGRYGIRRSRMW